MTRDIERLLDMATGDFIEFGVVLADVLAQLDEAGYDLEDLDAYLEARISEYPSAEIIPFPNRDEITD
jgi:hypothetical protein